MNTWAWTMGAPFASRTCPSTRPVAGIRAIGAAPVVATVRSRSNARPGTRRTQDRTGSRIGAPNAEDCIRPPRRGGSGCVLEMPQEARLAQRSRARRPDLQRASFDQEKTLQQVTALLGHQTSDDLGTVVRARVTQEIIYRAGHPTAGIIGTEHHSADF